MAFMQRCSTSLTGNLVAAAIDSKDINREAPDRGRENAAWINAIRQIFCRRKLTEALRIGWICQLDELHPRNVSLPLLQSCWRVNRICRYLQR